MRLKLDGKSYREIGEELGISPEVACRLVKAQVAEAAKARRDDAEDYVALQQMRLERMWNALQPGILSGSSRSIEVGLKLLEREAKLLGLDAPEKSVLQLTYQAMSDEDLIEESRRARVDLARVIPHASMLLPGEPSVPPGLGPAAPNDVVDAEFTETVVTPSDDARPTPAPGPEGA